MDKYEIPEIQIEKVEILSDAWKPLKQFTIHYEQRVGSLKNRRTKYFPIFI